MAKSNYAERFKKIEHHVDVINSELSGIKEEIIEIKTNWQWTRYIIGINVSLWVVAIGVIIKSLMGG